MDKSIMKKIKRYNFSKSLDEYSVAIKLKASTKKKSEDEKSILKLDRWIQEELCSTVNAREEPHINREELVDLMKWKLLRGKWRPNLIKFAESNSPTFVEELSNTAILLANKNEIEEAIQTLCKLKGVGPATASAILSTCVPDRCAFFADEVAKVFLEGKINYTLKEYMHFHEEISAVSNHLNQKEDERQWNPHEIELAIWTDSIMQEYNSKSTMEKGEESTEDLSPTSKRARR